MKRHGPDPSRPKSTDRRELDRLEAERGHRHRQTGKPPEALPYAELGVMTNYSFLHGASHPSDLIARAMELGLHAIGIADRNSVAGVVRAYVALRDAPEKARQAWMDAKKEKGEAPALTAGEQAACETDLRLVVGARLVFVDGTPDILAYPTSRFGWGRLTRLLTRGNMLAVKGDCILRMGDLIAHLDDMQLVVMPFSTARLQRGHASPPDYPVDDRQPEGDAPHLRLVSSSLPPMDWTGTLRLLQGKAPGRVWLGLCLRYQGRDARHMARMQGVAAELNVPLLATNDVLYAEESARPLQDVLSCIREGVTLKEAGRRLEANSERHLKSPAEMARLFASCQQAVAETIRFVEGIGFRLTDLQYEYPHEPVPPGWSPDGWLEHLVRSRAKRRYGRRLPPKVEALIRQELRLIRKRKYAYYFLTVHDLVRFARTRKPPILCQGRGSAANSIVCFLLDVTSIDPMHHDLLFSRFVSEERDEPPDIDVDFEHERREEVMQYIYRRYGRERAGIAATVIHYRSRSALREVTKVLGLSEDVAARLSSTVWGSYSGDLGDARFVEAGFGLDNPEMVRLRSLVEQLIRAPFARHLSQHVGGFVLTQNRLDETVPIHNAAMPDRSFIEWDKDDIDALGLMKVDVLALGMLSCIRRSYELMRCHGLGDHDLKVDIESNDPAVYRMLQKGDSIGVFQVESRAQINMLPRLKPQDLYDLTVQVAIVRPGPIEGDMVHPYLRRCCGEEEIEFPFPHPAHGPRDELRTLLGKTYGVPLFQEQAMKLAIVAAGFSSSEANQLRRAMATFRNVGTIHHFREKMINGMVARGYKAEFAQRCFKQIEGFGSYGFPESHALSFARLVYVSAWIKCHQPAVFACALLNSQPMGFYAPAQIVRDARDHGVSVHDVDVNMSGWDNSLEPLLRSRDSRRGEGQGRALALRLGLRQVDGFREDWAQRLVAVRAGELFSSVEDLARRAGLPARALRLLADADACRSLGQDRRTALWEARRTPSDELPLFAAARTRDNQVRELGEEPDAMLPAMALSEQVVTDYAVTRLSLKGHPMQFLRPVFAAEGVLSCAQTSAAKNGALVKTAGVVLVRQRPGKGNAVFITIEDETGITNILLWARLFEMQRRPVMASRLVLVEGEVQRSKEGVVHLMASRVHDRTTELSRLSEGPAADASRARPRSASHPRNVRILPQSRDFH
ncbi:error-prone DNA polymerase [Sphingobium sp. LB126]|uniref:error-prone DNA polymerase n=1 Tax=Sphingobium sp. LB126 TaxID=1983755 RepID=UPI000C2045AA|nr:error-prone DNA polymerase [Sphingobium sp. LB126]PJG48643.1 error-prone DNA polymerase [Sphingobium sp. LB126]